MIVYAGSVVKVPMGVDEWVRSERARLNWGCARRVSSPYPNPIDGLIDEMNDLITQMRAPRVRRQFALELWERMRP